MDKFEKHIEKNRARFDSKEPPAEIWDNITDELSPKSEKQTFNYNFIWKAAAVVFFALSVYLIFDRNSELERQDPLWAEFQITEKYYTSVINSKKSQVISMSELDDELSTDFKTDLEELDSMYNVLLNEYQSTGNEQVMDALIQNMRVRINVLDDQLEILQNVKDFNNYNDETITI